MASELYQPTRADLQEVRAHALLSAFELGAPLSVADYESWVALDWKQPHGSSEAAVRYAEKLVEEAGQELPGATTRFERIGELGDVLYCSTAALVNSGISLDNALRTRMGITHESVQFQLVDSILATARTPISLRMGRATIDRLDQEPLVQQFGVHYSSIADPAQRFIAAKAGELGYATIEAFGRAHGNVENLNPDDKAMLGQVGGDLFWAIARYAHAGLDTDLYGVARANIVKVTGRVLTGTIDKADGRRVY